MAEYASLNIPYGLDDSRLNYFSQFDAELNCPHVFAFDSAVYEVGAIANPTDSEIFRPTHIIHSMP